MTREIKTWLTDMDGVLVHEDRPLPGAKEFLDTLREKGYPYLVLTNNSIFTRRDLSARGLPPERGTTLQEAVLLIAPYNTASQTVARTLGARPTGELVPHPAGGTRRAQRWVLDLRAR